MYFFNSIANPSWDDQAQPPMDTESIARRRRIADAILGGIEGARDTGFPREHPDEWIECALGLSDDDAAVFVHEDYVHIDVRYRSIRESRVQGLTPRLHKLADILMEVAGYDFFEHGCQGLFAQGSIDSVEHALADYAPDKAQGRSGGTP